MSAQQVAPTRMALQTYKGKLVGAKKGYELLKKKSDALKVKFTLPKRPAHIYSTIHCSTVARQRAFEESSVAVGKARAVRKL